MGEKLLYLDMFLRLLLVFIAPAILSGNPAAPHPCCALAEKQLQRAEPQAEAAQAAGLQFSDVEICTQEL